MSVVLGVFFAAGGGGSVPVVIALLVCASGFRFKRARQRAVSASRRDNLFIATSVRVFLGASVLMVVAVYGTKGGPHSQRARERAVVPRIIERRSEAPQGGTED
jgi:hypothetical protein